MLERGTVVAGTPVERFGLMGSVCVGAIFMGNELLGVGAADRGPADIGADGIGTAGEGAMGVTGAEGSCAGKPPEGGKA
jgi:hypothetical protein